MEWSTIDVRFDNQVCYITFNRPELKNTINNTLINEITEVINVCHDRCKIIIFEGSKEYFCFGADFNDLSSQMAADSSQVNDPTPLYNLWENMVKGPFVTVSHVQGNANAGGLGFIAASDIVIADETAKFSLSELLFGLFPACVLPFLIRRIGFQNANYLTLMTRPISAEQAKSIKLVDEYGKDSSKLLMQHLMRLNCLPKNGITEYKKFMWSIQDTITQSKENAISANKECFSNTENRERIANFIKTGKFPWQ